MSINHCRYCSIEVPEKKILKFVFLYIYFHAVLCKRFTWKIKWPKGGLLNVLWALLLTQLTIPVIFPNLTGIFHIIYKFKTFSIKMLCTKTCNEQGRVVLEKAYKIIKTKKNLPQTVMIGLYHIYIQNQHIDQFYLFQNIPCRLQL